MEEKYRKELKRLKNQIVKGYKPEKIVLFGSLAFGKVGPNSDIDLLVIKKSRKDYWTRAREIAKIIDVDVPTDVLNITPEELRKRSLLGDRFLTDVINNGKVIYERA